jgi:hypothetical protein
MPPLRSLPYMQAQPNFGTKFAWSFYTAEYVLHLRDAPAALRGNCDASEILGPDLYNATTRPISGLVAINTMATYLLEYPEQALCPRHQELILTKRA